MNASLIGIIPYSGVDLGTFSLLKDKYVLYYHKQPGVFSLLLIGAISSTSGQIVAYPLALTRTLLQIQGMGISKTKYKGIRDCMTKIVRSQGVLGLYRGILPNFMKAIPAISANYAVYEMLKNSFYKSSE